MPDTDDGGLAGSVEIFLAVGREDPRAFSTNGRGKRFLEIAGKERRHGKIVTEAVPGAIYASRHLRDGKKKCGRLARKILGGMECGSFGGRQVRLR